MPMHTFVWPSKRKGFTGAPKQKPKGPVYKEVPCVICDRSIRLRDGFHGAHIACAITAVEIEVDARHA